MVAALCQHCADARLLPRSLSLSPGSLAGSSAHTLVALVDRRFAAGGRDGGHATAMRRRWLRVVPAIALGRRHLRSRRALGGCAAVWGLKPTSYGIVEDPPQADNRTRPRLLIPGVNAFAPPTPARAARSESFMAARTLSSEGFASIGLSGFKPFSDRLRVLLVRERLKRGHARRALARLRLGSRGSPLRTRAHFVQGQRSVCGWCAVRCHSRVSGAPERGERGTFSFPSATPFEHAVRYALHQCPLRYN